MCIRDSVQVPLSTFYGLGEPGAEVIFRVHTHVREDALALFGFATTVELQLFELLIGISGIGPRLALAVLSGIEPSELVRAVRQGDMGRLTGIPGVGKKTAERMALELKEKVDDLVLVPLGSGPRGIRQDVLSALENLGYRPRDAERALDKVEDPADQFETLLKQTLRVLAN